MTRGGRQCITVSAVATLRKPEAGACAGATSVVAVGEKNNNKKKDANRLYRSSRFSVRNIR